MVSEVRAEINFSKYLKISQSILDKCINALGIYTEEDLQIRKEILNSINEIWAIFNETLPDNFFEIFPSSVSSIIILVKLCTLIFNNLDREVDAENKLEACRLLDKHVELIDEAHRERSINLSIELKTQTLIAGLIINESINEIIEQVFVSNDIFNEKNATRIEEIYTQKDLVTLKNKFPSELFEIDFISYIIYFINNFSELFLDQKETDLGKIEWNHPASDEIKFRLKYGRPKEEGDVDEEFSKEKEKKTETKKSKRRGRPKSDKNLDTSNSTKKVKTRGRKRKSEKNNEDSSDENADNKTKDQESKETDSLLADDTLVVNDSEKSTEASAQNDEDTKDTKKSEVDDIDSDEPVIVKRHIKKRWNEEQEKFLEECIRNNNFVIEPKKFYDEHGPNGTISHNLGEFTVNNIRDKCKSEKRKRIRMKKSLGVYANSINNSRHIQMQIQNELINNKRVPNCRRRRWTDEQLKCLEKCILESNGNIYPSLILNLHGPNGIQSNILGNQTRQSIHDKCKNEKWKRIQQGLPLGAFEKAAKKSISSIGNKWRNTKVLKEYVACSEGKRRKRNVDPYYKPEHPRKSKKSKKDGTNEDSNEVSGSSNVETSQSQSQDNAESSTGYDVNFAIAIPGSYNNFQNGESTNESFIRINDADAAIIAGTIGQTGKEPTFPFIPTDSATPSTTDINQSTGITETNSELYIKSDVNNNNNTNIPTKQGYDNENPFQFNEKETTDFYFQQNSTEEKVDTPTTFTTFENKNDENSNKNNINNRTDSKLSSSKPEIESDIYKAKPIATE